MANPVKYMNVLPLNVQDYYSPSSQIDFNFKIGDGCRMLANSLKLSGQFIPYRNLGSNNDNNLTGEYDVRMNSSVGMHSAFSMFITSVNGSQKEAITYYPRLIAHRNFVQDSSDGLQSNLRYTSEGVCGNDAMSAKLLLGTTSTENISALSTNAPLRYMPFCITPKICLNNAVDGSGMPVDLNSSACAGGINLTTRLSLPVEMFYGVDANSITYCLRNLELSWTEIPDEKPVGEVLLRCTEWLSGAINSGTTTISHQLANPASSFNISFIAKNHQNTAKFDNLALEVLPSLTRLETMVADRNLVYKYIQQQQNEIVWNAVNSLENYNGKSLLNVDNYSHQDSSYGGMLGLNFGGMLPAMTRVGLNIVSGATNNNDRTGPFVYFMYLSTLQKL